MENTGGGDGEEQPPIHLDPEAYHTWWGARPATAKCCGSRRGRPVSGEERRKHGVGGADALLPAQLRGGFELLAGVGAGKAQGEPGVGLGPEGGRGGEKAPGFEEPGLDDAVEGLDVDPPGVAPRRDGEAGGAELRLDDAALAAPPSARWQAAARMKPTERSSAQPGKVVPVMQSRAVYSRAGPLTARMAGRHSGMSRVA
jgi:hypothetical protein